MKIDTVKIFRDAIAGRLVKMAPEARPAFMQRVKADYLRLAVRATERDWTAMAALINTKLRELEARASKAPK